MTNLQNTSHKETNSLESSKPKLNAKDKMKLLNLLTVILPAQKRFGTTEREMEAIIEVWARALGEYSIQQIVDAAWKYVKIRPDVPAASDINNIIKHGYPEARDNRYVKPTQSEIL